MEHYSLYHTLNKDVSSKKFPVSKKRVLQSKIKSLDSTSKEAFLMLICEHARIHNEFVYTPKEGCLPYKGIQKGDDTVFDMKDLPDQLLWILSKFLNIIH